MEFPSSASRPIRPCPACSAVPRLMASMLDPKNGCLVKVYQCRCGKIVWDDLEPASLT